MTIRARAAAARGLGCGLAALALMGCETPTPPTQVAMLADALPDGTAIPAAWSTAGAPTSAVNGDWVASFRDPTMTRLVNEALRNNPDLVAAAARVEAALQTVVIAGAPILPQVGLEADALRADNRTRDVVSDIHGGALVASWEIDLWGRLRSDRAAAAAAAQSVAQDAVYAQQSIAAAVARSWIANIKLAKLDAVARQSEGVYANLLELSDEKAAAGLVSDFDIVQARARLNASKAAISKIDTVQNEAIGTLEALLGRYPSLKLRPGTSYPRMPGALPASGVPLSLLDRRPDVLAARSQVIAAFYNVEVAKLARLPGISMSAAAGRLVDPGFALAGASPEFLRIGIGLLQPIFTGGALEADVVRMTADQAAAVAEYGKTVLDAYREVETALANEQVLRSELASWRASLNDANEALVFANDNYIAGTIDMTGLLVLQQFQIDREINVIETEAALLDNRIALYMALAEPI